MKSKVNGMPKPFKDQRRALTVDPKIESAVASTTLPIKSIRRNPRSLSRRPEPTPYPRMRTPTDSPVSPNGCLTPEPLPPLLLIPGNFTDSPVSPNGCLTPEPLPPLLLIPGNFSTYDHPHNQLSLVMVKELWLLRRERCASPSGLLVLSCLPSRRLVSLPDSFLLVNLRLKVLPHCSQIKKQSSFNNPRPLQTSYWKAILHTGKMPNWNTQMNNVRALHYQTCTLKLGKHMILQ
ncbi:hypothetical protein DFS34DRAFT_659741 [Phlyctochytrium arcticum]|nr:hypothetical protein DFS34DRAFT_659741 [Phlyctochytrium arcticum]